MDFDSLVYRPRLLLPARELWHGSPLVNPVQSRFQQSLISQGLVVQSFDRNILISNAQALASGQMNGAGVYLFAGDVITNAHWEVYVAGTSVTIGRVGLYNTAGTLLASSANDTAIWTATAGMRTKALSAPYTVLVSGWHYVHLLPVFSGTAPQIGRATNVNFYNLSVNGGQTPNNVQTGLSDLPSPATFALGSWTPWIALS